MTRSLPFLQHPTPSPVSPAQIEPLSRGILCCMVQSRERASLLDLIFVEPSFPLHGSVELSHTLLIIPSETYLFSRLRIREP